MVEFELSCMPQAGTANSRYLAFFFLPTGIVARRGTGAKRCSSTVSGSSLHLGYTRGASITTTLPTQLKPKNRPADRVEEKPCGAFDEKSMITLFRENHLLLPINYLPRWLS